jgi:quercetin dioxygenase-like cupin family protein
LTLFYNRSILTIAIHLYSCAYYICNLYDVKDRTSVSIVCPVLDFESILDTFTCMLKRHYTEVKEDVPSLAGTKGCTVQWLISKEQGAKRCAMRLFTLQPGGTIPLHEHGDTEHEIYIIEGKGLLEDGREKIPVRSGDVLFIPAGEKHSFVNQTQQTLKFICVIPL